MGSIKRFVKKIPPSGGAPSYKLTLPHQLVHQYLLHLVDNDLELAASPDVEQVWHASIVPRRNKERSEFTLQGWRLFAEAHKIQAGDQVAFELVTEARLVAQIIKHMEGPLLSKAQKVQSTKRKAATGPCVPRNVLQCSGGPRDSFQAMLDVFLPTEEERGISSEARPSAMVPWDSQMDAKTPFSPQSQTSKPQVVPTWATDDGITSQVLDFSNVIIPSRSSALSILVPELSTSFCQGSLGNPQSPVAIVSHPDVLDDPLHGISLGDYEPFMPEDDGSNAPSQQPLLAPTATSTLPTAEAQNLVNGQMEDLTAMVQNLQNQAQDAQSEAEASYRKCERLRCNLQGLQAGLRAHSRHALKATMGLENCYARLTYSHNVPVTVTSSLGQLKESLSQLLVMAIDEDLMGSPPPVISISSGSSDRFSMPT